MNNNRLMIGPDPGPVPVSYFDAMQPQLHPLGVTSDRRSAASSYRGCILRTSEQLENLASEWNELFTRVRCNNVFLSHQWMATWWNHFGRGHRLLVVEVRDDAERLVALAPLYVSRGVVGTRRLGILADRFVGSEYLDFIVERRHRAAVVKMIVDVLQRHRGEYDYIEFVDTAAGSIVSTFFAEIVSATGVIYTSSPAGICPYLLLPDNTDGSDHNPVDTCVHSRNHRSRQKRKDKRYNKALEREGEVDFVTCDSDASLQSAFEDLLRLHRARFHARGDLSDFDKAVPFHREVLPKISKAGWLRIHLLILNNRPVAAASGFSIAGKMYFYQSGIDPQYGRLSLGWLVISRALEVVANTHHTEVDFLRGDQSYKYQWAKNSRQVSDLRFYDRRITSQGVRYAFAIRQTLSKLKQLFRRYRPFTAAPATVADSSSAPASR